MVRREIVANGHKKPVTGRDLISAQKLRSLKTLNKEEFEKFFKENQAPGEWKEEVSGSQVYIVCLDTFPTPHRENNFDESVLYAHWSEFFKEWIVTYQRTDLSNKWEEIIAILVTA